MSASAYPNHDPPPAYTRKPSLLEPVIPIASPPGPAQHRRFLPGDDDENALISPPLSPDAELPPVYTPLDETVAAFVLQPPFIYAKGSSVFPRYQLLIEYTRSGKPFRLRIRRLLGSESRRLSLVGTRRDDSAGKSKDTVPYDDDMTMYIIENVSGLSMFSASAGSNLDIRGRQARTLDGYVRLQNERGGKARFTHVTRNVKGDALREENEKKMHKWGYKPDDEVNKALLFSVHAESLSLMSKNRKFEWRNGDEEVVATEWSDGSLEIVKEMDRKNRDILVTCWTAKCWANNSVSWRGDKALELPLRRAATTST
jgi:hypothetical protein